MTRTMCAVALCGVLACGAMAEPIQLTVSNPLDVARPAAICVGPAALLGADMAPSAYTGTTADGRAVAVQVDDVNGDGAADELAMVLDLPAAGSTTVAVDLARPWQGADYADARTSWRYENYAVLDTDRMGFGQYGTYAPLGFAAGLQWDLYAKRPGAWRLSLDELESIDYHSDNPVAVDILLVGNSLALGGPMIGDSRPISGSNATQACRVLCDGPVRAGLRVTVTDWQTAGGAVGATIDYLVYAHHDFIDAHCRFDRMPADAGDFGLGVRRIPHPDAFLGAAEEGILGVMGRQEGIIGQTGLGLIFDPARFLRWDVMAGADDAYVVRLAPDGGGYRAWLVGVWEHGGIATAETFPQHLRDLAGRFGAPATISR